MDNPSPLQIPGFRWTLFYGPEQSEASACTQHCVFNLKKRSWKGGIQVVVEIQDAQITRANRSLDFPEWLTNRLSTIPEEDRSECQKLGEDLLAQHICLLKLRLAISNGIQQENCCIDGTRFIEELDQAIAEHHLLIKSQILGELDLESYLPSSLETE
jgi:hypothetical protein